MASSYETNLLGSIMANIVGLQHYAGTFRVRERLALVREPSSIHDERAIEVLNTRGMRVGYVKSTVAQVLAPLMDAGLISVEAIVPQACRTSNLKFIKSQVHVFARLEDFEYVKSSVLEGKLILTPPVGEEVRTVDESFALVGQNVEKKAKTEALEPPSDIIKSTLLEHQKQGLGWLVDRENTEELPPFWEEMEGGHGYVNVLTNHRPDERPDPLRGGIFADQMGLGKTLTLLSLIALDKFDGSMVSVQSDSIMGKRKEKIGILNGGVSQKKGKTGENSSSSNWNVTSKSTLVVCPPSALSTWMTQLSEHTLPGMLKVYTYHGRWTGDAEELRKHDIVLTTYGILANEEPLEESPVKKIEWWRVILDEAHLIKNVNAQQSRAVTNLKTRRRWAVTGVPLQNGPSDLFSLMAFLRFEPFSIKSYWQSLIQHPLSQRNQTGLSRLQVLMATLSLRRTKDEVLIGLPEKTIETCYVELSSEERGLYDRMELEAKEYINAGRLMHNYPVVLGIILRLRQICSSMALCPPEVTSLLPSNAIEDVSNDPELLKKLVAVLQDSEDIDCPICISPCTSLIITRCAHIYCRACILKTLQGSKRQCPLCRGPLTESDLFSAPPESSKSGEVESCSSAKVSALLSLLLAAKDRNLSSKSVVYSQFRRMLLLLEGPLREAGFKILRVDGSMNANRRQEVIEEFGVPEQSRPSVLLASLKACGAGINLAAASTVYLLEPWWNPAVEEQAMDRVHRIGQKEDVKIVRLIASNTIEELILKLQERKKTLAGKAFGKWASTYGTEIGLDDLRALVSS